MALTRRSTSARKEQRVLGPLFGPDGASKATLSRRSRLDEEVPSRARTRTRTRTRTRMMRTQTDRWTRIARNSADGGSRPVPGRWPRSVSAPAITFSAAYAVRTITRTEKTPVMADKCIRGAGAALRSKGRRSHGRSGPTTLWLGPARGGSSEEDRWDRPGKCRSALRRTSLDVAVKETRSSDSSAVLTW